MSFYLDKDTTTNLNKLAKLTGLNSASELLRMAGAMWQDERLQSVLNELAADYRRQMVEQAARLRPEGGRDE